MTSDPEYARPTPRRRTPAGGGIPPTSGRRTVMSILSVDATVGLPGGGWHLGRVSVLCRPSAAPGRGGDRTRRTESAVWVAPFRRVRTRLASRGVPLGEAARGLAGALETLAGLWVAPPSREEPAGGMDGSPAGGPVGTVPMGGPSPVEGPVAFLVTSSARDAAALHAAADSLLADCLEMVRTCECARGCASCTAAPADRRRRDAFVLRAVPDRRHTEALLGELLGEPIASEESRAPLELHRVRRIPPRSR